MAMLTFFAIMYMWGCKSWPRNVVDKQWISKDTLTDTWDTGERKS